MKTFQIPALIIFTASFPNLTYANDQKLNLRRVLEIAEQHHPNISIQKALIDEAQAQKQSSPSLPPPTVFGSIMGSNGPLNSNGQMENSIGVSQTIPFPTKLTSEAKVKRIEASYAESKLQSETLNIRTEAKAAFFELYGTRKKISLLEEKKKIFEEHNRRLQSTILSDRIVQAHRIWVLTEIELINNEIIVAREDERVATGKLNVAMGNDPFTTILELEEPPLSESPKISAEIQSSHPDLRSLELSQNAAQSAITQAKSLWLPDLTISYRNAKRFDGLMPNYSEVTVGLTLPFLFFWQTNGQINSANARAREAEAKIEKTRNDLKMQLLESRERVTSLKEQLSNFETKIIPQAEKRMKIAHGLVPSDIESLNEHRDAMESVIKLKISALNLRINYEKAVAKLESLLAGNEFNKETL